MQPALESHQPHASAEERLAEQAKETQQLREQLARASVKEGRTLPPLSVPELNKETSGCPTLWGCSKVCIGKNIANCSKNPQFLPAVCALCPRCARAVHTRPQCALRAVLNHVVAEIQWVERLWGRLKHSACTVQLFGRLGVSETHALRY